ncbi:antibiotic biosynthesis monooxygenase [Agromyces mangrovi Wang et al. 2018]|uniref:antibiotic biosynthesis monooxygenase n=1 Tax=Agromyces mangrovi TaxID=1858653 RepID=UPI0025727C3E|nr:antibiotic biosynthesis monooxygenase [Agromyces mangrovi]BDZ64240.1 antibiotic biosynthesis monooxygenase [Agromyces mangrovi]
MPAQPITVSIRREVDPDRIPEVTAWVQAGVNLANRYPGFLGSGWIRAGADSQVWHMLYRFASEQTLAAWEDSSERRWWLSTGEGLIRSERSTRRTGIEGWFDEPTGAIPTVGDEPAVPPAPPRWKQAVAIWLGFFPVNVVFSYLVGGIPGWEALPIWLQSLALTLVLTPLMTYFVLPWVTRLLQPWLHRAR